MIFEWSCDYTSCHPIRVRRKWSRDLLAVSKQSAYWVLCLAMIPDSIDKYLSLSQSLSNLSIITSPMVYPQDQGWQCLRFWFYSGKNYFERSLSVSFVSENDSKQVWSYNSANDNWNFIQLQISKNYTSLKVKWFIERIKLKRAQEQGEGGGFMSQAVEQGAIGRDTR